MTQIVDPPAPVLPTWMLRAHLLAVALNGFAIIVVNYWIYTARWRYIALFPDRVAEDPPTISRAIEAPSIGEPFSFWVTVSGICLVYGVYWNAFYFRRLAARSTDPSGYVRGILAYGPALVVLMQASAALGMYLLSSYRFPDYHGMHMVGSYMFFLSQVFVIIGGTLMCDAVLRGYGRMGPKDRAYLSGGAGLRFRRLFGIASVVLTVVYLTLFVLKGIDLGAANAGLYLAYVSVEPMVISGFLLCHGLYQIDLLRHRTTA